MKKVFVIGLDCAAPGIVFDNRNEFPNINRLIGRGTHAPFRSIHPPITIPAWMAMATGKDAGEQGIYGFRHRKPGTYNDMWLSMADRFKEPAIWDIIGEKGLRSCLVSVPPSYPPMPLNGERVSCFMTPGPEKDYTYPASLKAEIEGKFGPFIFDVKFRTEDRDKLKEDLFRMTEQHIEVVKYLIKEKPWQFFMYVEIGVDRVHHAFWKFFDKEHRGYTPGNKYENVIMDYYRFIDKGIGQMLDLLADDTVVFVVSDHGVKPMKGAFCVNQWLVEKGYLSVKGPVKEGTSIEELEIDWKNTKAWAWGGYYSRVFLNVKGREKQGTIMPFRYEAWRDKLKKEIEAIKGPAGEPLETKAYRPEELYGTVKGDYPDLMVYFDDLSWRAAGTMGHKSMYLSENDTGPDDAMHDWDGIFIMYDPADPSPRELKSVSILDLAPTVLDLMGLQVPAGMKGRSVAKVG